MQKKEPKKTNTDPKPPRPLYCFDLGTGTFCPYDQMDFTATSQAPPRAFCLYYKRKLEIDTEISFLSARRCTECLIEFSHQHNKIGWTNCKLMMDRSINKAKQGLTNLQAYIRIIGDKPDKEEVKSAKSKLSFLKDRFLEMALILIQMEKLSNERNHNEE